MNELISVVIPVYNVEKYLSKCIESILNQTYKKLEIILVDDGSSDLSRNICDEYCKKDIRIKVIHKENGGLSDARNVGILNATGKYICFIDSDDYIEKNMLELLYLDIKNNDSDISCCGKVCEYPTNTIRYNDKSDFCISNMEALRKMLLKDEIDNSACDKLFKIELFENIKFPVGRYYEDIATIYKTFMISEKISHIKNIGYHYCMRNNSISKEKFSLKQIDALEYSKIMSEEIGKKYQELKSEAQSFYYLELLTTLRKMKKSYNFKEFKKEYKEIKKEFNNNFLSFLNNKDIVVYKKIMAILMFFNLSKLLELINKIITRKK